MSHRLYRALLGVLLLMVSGTLVYHKLEGWHWIDSFYFTGVTLLTLGYGDLTPTHDLSKILTVVFGFASISVGFYALTAVAEEIEKRFHRIQAPNWPFTPPEPPKAKKTEPSTPKKIA